MEEETRRLADSVFGALDAKHEWEYRAGIVNEAASLLEQLRSNLKEIECLSGRIERCAAELDVCHRQETERVLEALEPYGEDCDDAWR